MNEIEKELEAMAKSLDSPVSTESDEIEETPVVVEPVVEPKEPEAKVEPVVEPVVEPKPEVTPEPVPDPRDTRIKELEAQLAAAAAKPPEPKPEPKIEPVSEDFITENEDLDELTRDPKKLNEKFKAVYERGMKDSRDLVLAKMPELIAQQIELGKQVEAITTKFYTENSDLSSFKGVVKVVFEELAKANPSKTFDQVMKDTAIESRKRLNLQTPKPVEKKKDPPPTLPIPGKRAGSVTSDKKSDGLITELDDMSKALNL
jgi:hypothetical protein